MKLSVWIAAAITIAAPVEAQVNPMLLADVLGQTVARMSSGAPPACYDGRMQPKPKDLVDGRTRVESAIQSYRQTASATTDLKPLFTGSSKEIWHWDIDGAEQDVRATRDPWAARVARVEPIGLAVSNQGYSYRALWRAVAQDGTVLGIYDAWLYKKGKDTARFLQLKLYSEGAAKQPDALTPFCYSPGDIETWKEAKAKREAKKAAKRAARAAANGG